MHRLDSLQTEPPRMAEINMSPLVDMVFLLLIFFMVTAVFVEEVGVDVEKPAAASAKTLEKQSVLIAVTEDGRVFHGGDEIGMNAVRGVVARQLREDRDMPVIVIADGGSRTRAVVDVLDECKLAGAVRVSIATDRE